MPSYVATNRKIPISIAAVILGVSVCRVHQFLHCGRLRRLEGISPTPYGRRHVAMLDALEVMALAEQRSLCPPKPGRPRKESNQ